jgi:hypothetical protein
VPGVPSTSAAPPTRVRPGEPGPTGGATATNRVPTREGVGSDAMRAGGAPPLVTAPRL